MIKNILLSCLNSSDHIFKEQKQTNEEKALLDVGGSRWMID